MHAVRTKSSYCFEVDREKFLALCDWEATRSISSRDLDISPLMTELEKLGCSGIEYNGHFGPNIFFDLLAEDDHEFKHKAIAKCIREHVRRAVRAANNSKRKTNG